MKVGPSIETGAKATRTVARSGTGVGIATDEARAPSVAGADGDAGAGAHATRHHHTPTNAATPRASLTRCIIALPALAERHARAAPSSRRNRTDNGLRVVLVYSERNPT